MSKKKQVIKAAKSAIKERIKDILFEIEKASGEISNSECENEISELRLKVTSLYEEINSLKSKSSGKKKRQLEWLDTSYKATSRSKSDREYTSEYEKFTSKKSQNPNRPVAKWLTAGILVTQRGRDLPGIVLEVGEDRSTVLFGGLEIYARNLSLRPADW